MFLDFITSHCRITDRAVEKGWHVVTGNQCPPGQYHPVCTGGIGRIAIAEFNFQVPQSVIIIVGAV